MKTRILISLLLLCFVNAYCRAEDLAHTLEDQDAHYSKFWYVGAAIGSMNYQQSNLHSYGMSDRRLIVGKQLSKVFALEMHLGNASSDTQLVSGVPVSLSVDNYLAGFLKAKLTFTSKDWKYNRFQLYGMLGGTRIKTTSSDPVATSSGVQTSVSAGAGMEFFSDNLGIQLGYTRYVTGSANAHDYTLESLHLGVIYQFGGNQVVNAN